VIQRVVNKLLQFYCQTKVVNGPILKKIGSTYAGWMIPTDYLQPGAICILAGAGEDISFDVELAHSYNSEVFTLDPTPRAITHYNNIVDATLSGMKMPINNNQSIHYDISPGDLNHIQYFNLGLWDEDKELKFYTPKDPSHVSHSIQNHQDTKEYFIGKVTRLSKFCKDIGIDSIDILKLDIEGAEYKVIESIIKDNMDVKIICIEYEEIHNPLSINYWLRILKSISLLTKTGYSIIYLDSRFEFTFIKNTIL